MVTVSTLRIARALRGQLSPPGLRAVRENLLIGCTQFARCGLADQKFESELTCGDPDKFWSSVSESLVYQRLSSKTFLPRQKRGAGPDFLIEDGGRRVWIEVICPSPVGLTQQWLKPTHGAVVSKPADAILLRWTHAIKTKADRLIGTSFQRGYLETGLVRAEDAYVIAVNGCRFRHGPFSELDGISQLPYAVEALFPVGPMEIRMDCETLKPVNSGYQERWAIRKKTTCTSVEVPTHAFLDPRYRPVSAVWALDVNGFSAIGALEPTALVHNPNAINPIPLGWVAVDEEFQAVNGNNQELILKRV